MTSAAPTPINAATVSRRALILRRPNKDRPRPPWHRPEALFVELCRRCDACIERCPERIIKRGDGGFPQVDFSRGECTFCGACADVCPSGALNRSATEHPWRLAAGVGDRCLSGQGVLCALCREQCQTGAINMAYRAGGTGTSVPVPQIDAARCSGCGACYAVCPARAITLSESDPEGSKT